ncbi:diacylglycerol kinase [Sulfitobacter sp. SK011]|uniref:diacylglycerol kinase n=1 Tax=Sulfitobacter sp. SK011 TaxID=1389004 RepID=UPI0020C760B6|nr:diacylglycerol kinase [Sulfitobacter sp. SK011]
MDKQPLTGMARMITAYRNSMVGLRDIWRGEEAFRIEAVLCALSVPVALWIGEDFFQAAILFGAGLLLIIVEVINSAIEATIDRIGPERHELSRMAKDLGSLAVLLATVLLGILWLAALIDKFA